MPESTVNDVKRKPRRRWLRLLVGTLIAALTVAAVLSIAVWRFAAASLPVDLLRPYIERAIEGSSPGLDVDLNSLDIRWGGWGRGIDIVASDTNVALGDFTATIPEFVLKLSLRALLHRQIAPSEIDLVGVSGKLIREEDGTFRLAAVDADRERRVDAAALETLFALLGGPPDPTRPLTYLRHFRLREAAFDLEDRLLATSWKAERIDVELHAGLERISGLFRGAIVLDSDVDTTDVEGAFSFVEEDRLLHIEAAVDEVPFDSVATRLPAIQSRLRLRSTVACNADATVSLDGVLHTLQIEFSAGPGQIGVTNWLDTPEAILGVDGRILYDVANAAWSVEDVLLRFGEPGMSGPTFQASAQINSNEEDTTIEADVAVIDLAVADIARYWPPTVETGTRKWIVENITVGHVDRVDVELRLARSRDEATPATRLRHLSGTLRFRDLTVRWSDKAPLVTGIDGSGTIATDALRFSLSSGRAGAVEVEKATVDLLGIDAPPAQLQLDIDGTGPVEAALAAVNLRPPAFIGSLAPQDSPDANVAFHAEVVFSLAGRIEFDDLDIVVDAQVESIPIISDLGTGRADGHLSFAAARGARRLRGEADIAELASSLRFLGWSKEAGETGSVDFDLSLGAAGVEALHHFNVSTETLQATGSAAFKPASDKLRAIDFSSLRTGRTQTKMARVAWEHGGVHVAVAGGNIDLQPILTAPDSITGHARDKGDDGTLGVEFSDVDSVHLSAEGWLEDVSGSMQRDADGLRLLTLDGRVPASLSRKRASEARGVRLDVRPATVNTLRVELDSDDFGGLASAIGWTKAIYGGSLRLVIPDLPKKSIAGHVRLEATDFRLRDTPLAVRLLGLASLDSLVSVMQGEALHFENLTGDIELTSKTVLIEELRAHGSSLGWRAQGTIDRPTSGLNINGLLIPAYAANRILKAVPVLREVLVGEGLFAVDFHLGGTLTESEIDVHPLSALTPELLRGIFGYPDSRR